MTTPECNYLCKIKEITDHDNFELFILGCCLGLVIVLYFKMTELMNDYQRVNRENLSFTMTVATMIGAGVIDQGTFDELFKMYHEALVEEEEE